jgi:hypothetical protein
MDTQTLTVDRKEAAEMFRKYQEHRHYSTPIDLEIQRVYDAMAKGRVIVRAIASIAAAGLNDEGLPKLAIIRSDAKTCHLYMRHDGGARFSTQQRTQDNHRRCYIDMPPGSFAESRRRHMYFAAQAPLVPIHLRPKPRRGNPQGALANYHTLFEAEWTKIPPKDPLLLRRVGLGDLWIVCAAWDLTEVERAVLMGRMHA